MPGLIWRVDGDRKGVQHKISDVHCLSAHLQCSVPVILSACIAASRLADRISEGGRLPHEDPERRIVLVWTHPGLPGETSLLLMFSFQNEMLSVCYVKIKTMCLNLLVMYKILLASFLDMVYFGAVVTGYFLFRFSTAVFIICGNGFSTHSGIGWFVENLCSRCVQGYFASSGIQRSS